AIQVLHTIRRQGLDGCKRDHAALRAPAYRAREMAERSRAAAAWQNEILERLEIRVVAVERLLEALHVRGLDAVVPRDGKLAAQLEQIVLGAGQHIVEIAAWRFGEQQADAAV